MIKVCIILILTRVSEAEHNHQILTIINRKARHSTENVNAGKKNTEKNNNRQSLIITNNH